MQFQNEISSPASKHIFRPKFSGFFSIFFETGQKKNSNSFEIRQIFKKKGGQKSTEISEILVLLATPGKNHNVEIANPDYYSTQLDAWLKSHFILLLCKLCGLDCRDCQN